MLWQYFLPQHRLSRWIGKLANCRTPWLKNLFIHWFIRRYRVDMRLAADSNPLNYPHFNAFFTRALKPGLRPIAAGAYTIASPADGCVSQLGQIQDGRIFQAKGFQFSVLELLGGVDSRATPFLQGQFITIYLAPKDYHRVHMPFTGKLKEMVYVPGQLFSVNTQSASAIPRLFARNERMVAIFDTAIGDMAVVMVGAMIVAGIETVWGGAVTPSGSRKIQASRYTGTEILLNKGEELGRFQLGSTVILLFAKPEIRWNVQLAAEAPLLMGQALAEL